MGKSQRDKGANGEREVVKLLRSHGYTADRTAQLQAGGVERVQGDVTVFGVDAVAWPEHEWVSIEVKRDASVKLHTKALDDAMLQFGSGTGCVFWRGDRQRWALKCRAFNQTATFDAELVLEGVVDLGVWLRTVAGVLR